MISDILTDSPELSSGGGMPGWGIGVLVIGILFVLYWFYDKMKDSKKDTPNEEQGGEENGSQDSNGRPPESQ